MPRYVERPNEVDARQFKGGAEDGIAMVEWLHERDIQAVWISGGEGVVKFQSEFSDSEEVLPGDYVVVEEYLMGRELVHEVYPMPGSIFERWYDPHDVDQIASFLPPKARLSLGGPS